MKAIYILFIVLFSFVTLYGQNLTSTNELIDSETKIKVILLPLENRSDTNLYKNSDSLKLIVYKSLFTFLRVIPSLDLIEDTNLINAALDTNKKVEFADTVGADFIITGDYVLSGSKSNPKVAIKLEAWSRYLSADIMNKDYKTFTGPDLLDAVDQMIADNAEALLKNKVAIASVNFKNFITGNESYNLLMNGKTIGIITNDQFQLFQQILAETKYRVQLNRNRDQAVVLNQVVVLKAGQTTNINYQARSFVLINTVQDPKKDKIYTAIVNGNKIDFNTNIAIPAGKSNLIQVQDDTGNIVLNRTNHILDSETNIFYPSDFPKASLNVNLFTSGKEAYVLKWNSTNLTDVNTDVFLTNLQIHAGSTNYFSIVRRKDQKVLTNLQYILSENQTDNLLYRSSSLIQIKNIQNPKSGKTYTAQINGIAASFGIFVPVKTGESNSVVVMDNTGRIILKESVLLFDSDQVIYSPKERSSGPLSFIQIGNFDFGFLHFLFGYNYQMNLENKMRWTDLSAGLELNNQDLSYIQFTASLPPFSESFLTSDSKSGKDLYLQQYNMSAGVYSVQNDIFRLSTDMDFSYRTFKTADKQVYNDRKNLGMGFGLKAELFILYFRSGINIILPDFTAANSASSKPDFELFLNSGIRF